MADPVQFSCPLCKVEFNTIPIEVPIGMNRRVRELNKLLSKKKKKRIFLELRLVIWPSVFYKGLYEVYLFGTCKNQLFCLQVFFILYSGRGVEPKTSILEAWYYAIRSHNVV